MDDDLAKWRYDSRQSTNDFLRSFIVLVDLIDSLAQHQRWRDFLGSSKLAKPVLALARDRQLFRDLQLVVRSIEVCLFLGVVDGRVT